MLPPKKHTVTHQVQGIRSQRMAMGSAPGGYAAPENHQYPSVSKLGNRLRAVFQTPTSGWLTLEAPPTKRHSVRHAGDNQSRGFSPNPITSYRHGSNLSKRPHHIEFRMLLQHVITRSCQFIRHRFLGHHQMALGQLALVIAFDSRVPYRGKVRGFPERPGQIPVAILPVALPLMLATAQFSDFTQRT